MKKSFYVLAAMICCASAFAQQPEATTQAQPEAAPASQPATTQPAGVTFITLHMKQVLPEDIFDAIAKQAGVRFIDPSSVWAADDMSDPMDFNVDHQPFWQVVHDLCVKLKIQPYSNGVRNSNRISLQRANRDFNWGAIPYTLANGCMVQATGFNRNQSIQYGSSRPAHDSTTVQLTIYVDPALHMPAFKYLAKVNEAVDDAGNSMILPPRNDAPTYYEGFNQANGILASSQVPLFYPPKIGKKIASLKFNLTCRAALEVKTLTFDKLDQAQTLSTDNMDITVKNFKSVKGNNQPDRYSLTVQLDAEERSDAYSLLQSGQLQDARGRAFFSQGGSGGSSANGIYSYTFNYSSRNGDDDDTAGQPVKWVLDVPTRMRTISLPVELKDMPLP